MIELIFSRLLKKRSFTPKLPSKIRYNIQKVGCREKILQDTSINKSPIIKKQESNWLCVTRQWNITFPFAMGCNQPYLICTFRDMILAKGDRNQTDLFHSHLSFSLFRLVSDPPKKNEPKKENKNFWNEEFSSSPFSDRLSEGFLLILRLPRKICIIFFNGSIVC